MPSTGDPPSPGIEPASLPSPALAGGFFTTASPGKPTGLWREADQCKYSPDKRNLLESRSEQRLLGCVFFLRSGWRASLASVLGLPASLARRQKEHRLENDKENVPTAVRPALPLHNRCRYLAFLRCARSITIY